MTLKSKSSILSKQTKEKVSVLKSVSRNITSASNSSSMVISNKTKSKIPKLKRIYYMDDLIDELKENMVSLEEPVLAESIYLTESQKESNFKTTLPSRNAKKPFLDHFT